MSPGLINVISATSEKLTSRFRSFMEKYLLRSGWSSGISSPKRRESHHLVFIDLHEFFVFGRKYQGRRMAKIHKSELPIRPQFTVDHRCDFARAVV